MARRAMAVPANWPAPCSKHWPAWACCMCRTRAVRRCWWTCWRGVVWPSTPTRCTRNGTPEDFAALVRARVAQAGRHRQGSGATVELRGERLAALQRAFFAPGNDPSIWLEGWYPVLRDTYRSAAATPPRQAWWPVSNAPVLDLQGDGDPWRPAGTRNELRDVLGKQVTVRVIFCASRDPTAQRHALQITPLARSEFAEYTRRASIVDMARVTKNAPA